MKRYAFLSDDGEDTFVKAPSGESGREDVVIYDDIECAVKSKYFTNHKLEIIKIAILDVLE